MPGEEQDFYSQFREKLKHPWKSVDLYSVSACFGFYSKGMRTFAEVLGSMRTALVNPDPFRTQQMRLLLMADDNRIDLFGVERFHQYLEPVGLEIKRLDKPQDRRKWVQFALFDDAEALHTRPQSGTFDEALELGINRLEAAQITDAQQDPNKFRAMRDLFDGAWRESVAFDYPRIPTMQVLEEILTTRFPIMPRPEMTERDYLDQLYVLLHGICDPRMIHREFIIGSDRFDLVIGNPKIRLLAIEVKLATDDENILKRLKGQITSYRQLVRDVIVLLVGRSMSPQKLGDLEHDFRDDPHVKILRTK